MVSRLPGSGFRFAVLLLLMIKAILSAQRYTGIIQSHNWRCTSRCRALKGCTMGAAPGDNARWEVSAGQLQDVPHRVAEYYHKNSWNVSHESNPRFMKNLPRYVVVRRLQGVPRRAIVPAGMRRPRR